ncbi:MAG: hypothetical protein AB7I09_04580 [Planctomycetota bacterium]
MHVLTERSILICDHKLGVVQLQRSQSFVLIDEAAVLVAVDPEARPIKGCPYTGIGVVPCNVTFPVERGYSGWVKVEDRSVCLDTVRGLTNGSPPPGTFYYSVNNPAQEFVHEV